VLFAIATVLALSCARSQVAVPTATIQPVQPVQPVQPTSTDPVWPTPPTPAAGKASISGMLYSYAISRALPETVFYLTEPMIADGKVAYLVMLGPRKEIGDVFGVSDQSGGFVLSNIPPGDYCLLVWAPYDWIPAETSSQTHSPLLIRLAANQALDLGMIQLPWP
jgi:hypothetical protein